MTNKTIYSNCLLMLILVYSNAQVLAQDGYREMLAPGKRWYISDYNVHNAQEPYWITIGKDTMVHGTICKQILRQSTDRIKRKNVMAIEENKKVYSVTDNGDSLEYMLMLDFSLEVGDKVPGGGNHVNCYCLKIDTVTVGEEHFRRLLIGPDPQNLSMNSDFNIYWVEGIGTDTQMNTLLPLPETIIPTRTNTMLECYEGEKRIFTWDDFWKEGTPSSIRTTFTEASPTLYDLQGRQLKQKPSKGLYIQGGYIYKQ